MTAHATAYAPPRRCPPASPLDRGNPCPCRVAACNCIQGLQQGTIAGAGYANTGQVFPPYKSKQFEVGVQRDRGKLLTTLSLFQTKQPSAAVDTATNVYGVNGGQRNRGLELNVAGQLAPGVRLMGGFMLLDGTLVKTASHSYDGDTAPGTPRSAVNLGMEWDAPFAPGLTLFARGIHTGGRYYDQANTQRIPAWTRFDAGARYKASLSGRPVIYRINVNNRFNRNYRESALSDNGLSLGAPRTVMVSATLDL